MLQIDIIDSNGDNLVFEVDGHPNNGNSSVNKGSAVHWKVKPGCNVDYIDAIYMKDVTGSTDIFSANPPAAEAGSQRKNWKAKVNTDARRYSVYVYNIVWVKVGESQPRTYDPIIAIKPRLAPSLVNEVTIAIAVTAALGMAYVIFGQSTKWKKFRK